VKLRTDPLMAHLPKVWDAFIKVATRDDYKSIPAMRMAFEMAGIYREQMDIHHHKHGEGEQDISKMSYEELLDLERRMRMEQANRGVVDVPLSASQTSPASGEKDNPPGAIAAMQSPPTPPLARGAEKGTPSGPIPLSASQTSPASGETPLPTPPQSSPFCDEAAKQGGRMVVEEDGGMNEAGDGSEDVI